LLIVIGCHRRPVQQRPRASAPPGCAPPLAGLYAPSATDLLSGPLSAHDRADIARPVTSHADGIGQLDMP
jgi:hypothetical protein